MEDKPTKTPDDDNKTPTDNPLPESQPSEIKHPHSRKTTWIGAAILTVLLVAVVAALLLTRTKTTSTNSTASVNNSTVSSTSPSTSNANTWKGTVNPAAIPIGDNKVSTTPKVGYIDSCTTNFRGGGARHAGSWINSTNNTWDSKTKISVEGSVNWPNASYSATTSGNSRLITTNDLPKNYPTGNFPISRNDPAYQYDTNPNSIGAQSLTYTLSLNPTAAASPSCLPLGPIGVLNDGVVLFNGLDDAGRDAGAHETQDLCDGHPDGKDMYHYHFISNCVLNNAKGSSTLVGYALDGYGIYAERDSKGNLPTNADLDVCHGRTSQVMWNGKLTNIYHYDATLEYPYTLGCFRGTPASSR